MERVADWMECQRHVASVRRGGSGYTTNLYATREQVEPWCAAGILDVLTTNAAVLFLRRDRDFRHVYHVAENDDALSAALRLLPPGTYTADLVGQGDDLDRICAIYEAGGFAAHDLLRRMSRIQAPAEVGQGEAELARIEDAPEIAALLERLLDRFTEQLPEPHELEQAAVSGQLLIVRRGGVIKGMLMYAVKGQLAHLRFWHVDDNARGEGIGRRLMTSFLARCANARRLVLWVIGDNVRSIAIYRHYGFAEDGLLDRIMLLHKEQQE